MDFDGGSTVIHNEGRLKGWAMKWRLFWALNWWRRIIELLTQKIVISPLKTKGLGSGILDPGSGKNLFRIPDTGVKKTPIPDPDP